MRLPTQTELELLAALGAKRLTGRELAIRYKDHVEKSISYGTLYTTMARLKDEGWVTQEDSADADGRLRYFQMTGAGVEVFNERHKFFTHLFGAGAKA